MEADASAWDRAPVGLLRLDPDGLLLEANDTLLGWLGSTPAQVVGRGVTALLPAGGRIYWETHLSPLLHAEGRFDEVALELRVPGGRLPVLATAVVGPAVTDMSLTSARHRVRFERELQDARRVARTAERQVSALQEVTAALSEAVGVTAVVEALLDAVQGPLRAAAGTVWLTNPEGRLEHAGTRGAGGPTEAPELPATDDPRLVLALRGQRGLRGVLALVPPDDPGADPLDVDVCRAVAQQAGPALDRARTYEHSASVASQLQRALLVTELPVDRRFGVAAVYRPGVQALEVGGDWYDVFLVVPGLLAVVVGDVVGRGLGAATAMGQLRSAVRAIAAADLGPGRLLARLDRFAERTSAAAMATIAYAELDLASGMLRYACAGHPPPVLIQRDKPAQLLWDGRSTPLGAFTAPSTRPEATIELAPGDRLLLCTDGVFERRDRDLGQGLDVLVATADRLARGVLADDVTVVTNEMLAGEGAPDDACALLLEWTGDRFEYRLGGDLQGLSTARRALGRWLQDCGVDEGRRADLVLAASEALANAGEHGSGSDPDRFVDLAGWVTAGTDGRQVHLQVRDDGRWQHGPSSRDRGRGMHIMKALVDEVDVRSDLGTTVRMRRRLGAWL